MRLRIDIYGQPVPSSSNEKEISSATRESEEASQINIPLRDLPKHKRIQMRVHDSEIEELTRALHESEVSLSPPRGKRATIDDSQGNTETATAEKDTAESKVVILVNL